MKKILLITGIIFLFSFSLFGQDTTRSQAGTRYYVDSLTTAKDTINFEFDVDVLKTDKISIFATSTAVDTALVYVNSPDGVRWAQEGVLDMATNTVIASVIGATTTKELVLVSPGVRKLRLVSTSNDGSVLYVVVCAKRSLPYEN